ncbi:hypothetical protein DRH14_03205, partial [Candidatus Shapirobacteria bacterium]
KIVATTIPTKALQSTPTVAISMPSAIPTIDPTADWKTYKNDEYKIEFKYPKHWRYKKRDKTVVGQEIWFGTGDWKNVITFYVNKDKYLSFTKDGKHVTCQERGGDEITIGNNNEGLIEHISATQSPAQDWVCFEKNNLSYEFQHIYGFVVDSKDVFDQILSTFKFTD